jgi:peptidoglycan/xylan/chitin deacetylase (PgdA/CDA1 family)
MYHQVGDFHHIDRHRALFCHHRRFARQMAYLDNLGYRVLDLEEAVAGLSGATKLPARAVVLTFDDGYRNFEEYALPVLQRHGFPATVFLVSGRIGGRADWLEADGLDCPPLLDADAIRRLHRQGIRFGAHSVNHKHLTQLDDDHLRFEVEHSRAELETILDEPVKHFCYPAGDYDARVRRAVVDAGYRTALTCNRGDALAGDDPLQLPRKAISFGDSVAGFGWKLIRRKCKTTVEIRE